MQEGRVLVRRNGGVWSQPAVAAYDDEAHLQSLLAEEPQWIPGVPVESQAIKELQTSAGPIDVVIVDPTGVLTVVECKLASNSERRRMVIGQVIDYASALWIDGFDAFQRSWSARAARELGEYLGAEGMNRLRADIETPRIDLCLAVDTIDAELRRLVEFLNHMTSAEVRVTAIQLSYARDGEMEILIPSTYGGEIAEAKSRSSAAKESWTRETFLGSVALEADCDFAERLFALNDLAAANAGVAMEDAYFYGVRGGGQIFFHIGGTRYAPFSLWIRNTGELMVYGAWTNWAAEVNHHGGFSHIAALLGQDHTGRSASVPARSLDVEELWAAACQTAQDVNDAFAR